VAFIYPIFWRHEQLPAIDTLTHALSGALVARATAGFFAGAFPDLYAYSASLRDPLHDPAPRRDALDPPAVFLCIRVLRCGLRSSHGPESLS
jgi:hypothetical protein